MKWNSHELANTVCIFAQVGRASSAFFDAIAEAAKARLEATGSQHLDHTVWGFAIVEHASPTVFDVIAD
eukprot:10609762-Karenia_brevis.AAC.1